MMAYKKGSGDPGMATMKAEILSGKLRTLYIFHGEESYLKTHWLGKLKELACGAFEDFNFVMLEGDRLTWDDLVDAISTVPMGSEKKLVVVRDYKLMQPTGRFKEGLGELLEQLPEYICLVFMYDAEVFKADKRLNIYKTAEKHGLFVEFEQAPSNELIPWIKRRFQALGKDIGRFECEHLMFVCGYSMTNLITEVEKLAAGSAGKDITGMDIQALASRVLEADIFVLTDNIISGKTAVVMQTLRDLVDMKNEPVSILAAITRQMQRLYGAKLAIDAGKNENYVAELLEYRSSYPARLIMTAAGKMSLDWLRRAQRLCLECDILLKSNVPDPVRILEMLLLKLGVAA